MSTSGALRAALVVVVVGLAGCVAAPPAEPAASVTAVSPSASVSALASARPPASGSGGRSATPPATASATASAAPTPAPSWPHADAALEAYLPAEIRGMSLIRFSMPASAFTGGGDMCLLLCGSEPGDLGRALGVPVDSITVAFAIPDSTGLAIGAIAFRVKGAESAKLVRAGASLNGVVGGGGDPGFPVTIGGRDAYFVARLGRPQYLIPSGDVLVFIFGDPPTTAPNTISPDGSIPPDVEALVRLIP